MTGRRARGKVARRSAARLAAVQALYQIDHSGAAPGRVEEEFRQHRLGGSFDTGNDVAPDVDLFVELVRGVAAHERELDDVLRPSLAGGWTPERLAYVLRAILRAAVHELGERPETPARVIINEYVDVAHAFFDGPEPGMVNGVLDRLAQGMRPGEFEAAEAREE